MALALALELVGGWRVLWPARRLHRMFATAREIPLALVPASAGDAVGDEGARVKFSFVAEAPAATPSSAPLAGRSWQDGQPALFVLDEVWRQPAGSSRGEELVYSKQSGERLWASPDVAISLSGKATVDALASEGLVLDLRSWRTELTPVKSTLTLPDGQQIPVLAKPGDRFEGRERRVAPGDLLFVTGEAVHVGPGETELAATPDEPLYLSSRVEAQVEAGATSRYLLWQIGLQGLALLALFVGTRALFRKPRATPIA